MSAHLGSPCFARRLDNPGATPRLRSALRRLLLLPALWLGACVFGGVTAEAAIVGIVAGTNWTTFTFSSGGVAYAVLGPLPLGPTPAGTDSGFTPDPPTGFGQITVAYDFSPTMARVVIPADWSGIDPVLGAIASQGAPDPGAGAMETRADFSVSFSVDGGGVAGGLLPIAYAVAAGALGSQSFDAVIHYSSAALGPLGTSELHFVGPSAGFGEVISGLPLALPPLPALDTLSLSGSFVLVAASPDGASEMMAGVVPEPASVALVVAGLATMGVVRRRRASRSFRVAPSSAVGHE